MNEGLGKGKKADAGPPLKFDFVVPHEANPNPSPHLPLTLTSPQP